MFSLNSTSPLVQLVKLAQIIQLFQLDRLFLSHMNFCNYDRVYEPIYM